MATTSASMAARRSLGLLDLGLQPLHLASPLGDDLGHLRGAGLRRGDTTSAAWRSASGSHLLGPPELLMGRTDGGRRLGLRRRLDLGRLTLGLEPDGLGALRRGPGDGLDPVPEAGDRGLIDP